MTRQNSCLLCSLNQFQFFMALLQFVVSLLYIHHLPLVDTLSLEVDILVGVGWDVVEGFENTLAALLVQGIVVVLVAGLQRL
jgi:hypothetical protein